MMNQSNLTEKIQHLKSINDNTKPLFFILGPCVMESEKLVLETAEFLAKLSQSLKLHIIFKSSFDKANRTSLQGFRGIGMEQGCRLLARVREEFELPVITDIHVPSQAAFVAEHVDVVQIPAFLCRQTDMLIAAGKTNKIVHLKKGQFVTAESMGKAIDKIKSTGNESVWICERGYAFGYNNLIVDYRNFPVFKSFGVPAVFDATHSVQFPSLKNGCSGGDRTFVPPLTSAAVAQGIAGIFMEAHKTPEKALCDGANSIRLSQLENLLKYLVDLDAWVKERQMPAVS